MLMLVCFARSWSCNAIRNSHVTHLTTLLLDQAACKFTRRAPNHQHRVIPAAAAAASSSTPIPVSRRRPQSPQPLRQSILIPTLLNSWLLLRLLRLSNRPHLARQPLHLLTEFQSILICDFSHE